MKKQTCHGVEWWWWTCGLVLALVGVCVLWRWFTLTPPTHAYGGGAGERFITKKTHLADAGVTLDDPQQRALMSPGFG